MANFILTDQASDAHGRSSQEMHSFEFQRSSNDFKASFDPECGLETDQKPEHVLETLEGVNLLG